MSNPARCDLHHLFPADCIRQRCERASLPLRRGHGHAGLVVRVAHAKGPGSRGARCSSRAHVHKGDVARAMLYMSGAPRADVVGAATATSSRRGMPPTPSPSMSCSARRSSLSLQGVVPIPSSSARTSSTGWTDGAKLQLARRTVWAFLSYQVRYSSMLPV